MKDRKGVFPGSDNAVVGVLENGCIGVFVDGHDVF